MSEREVRIFELCRELAELLGDKEAVADLKGLYFKHPEMFKDIEDVANVIYAVVQEPEIIIKNPTPRSEKDFIAAKVLNERKMGEVGVREQEEGNLIFHANNKNVSKIKRLLKYEQMLVETSSTKVAPTRSNHYASESEDSPKCTQAPSTFANEIIPQQTEEISNTESEDDGEDMGGSHHRKKLR